VGRGAKAGRVSGIRLTQKRNRLTIPERVHRKEIYKRMVKSSERWLPTNTDLVESKKGRTQGETRRHRRRDKKKRNPSKKEPVSPRTQLMRPEDIRWEKGPGNQSQNNSSNVLADGGKRKYRSTMESRKLWGITRTLTQIKISKSQTKKWRGGKRRGEKGLCKKSRKLSFKILLSSLLDGESSTITYGKSHCDLIWGAQLNTAGWGIDSTQVCQVGAHLRILSLVFKCRRRTP